MSKGSVCALNVSQFPHWGTHSPAAGSAGCPQQSAECLSFRTDLGEDSCPTQDPSPPWGAHGQCLVQKGSQKPQCSLLGVEKSHPIPNPSLCLVLLPPLPWVLVWEPSPAIFLQARLNQSLFPVHLTHDRRSIFCGRGGEKKIRAQQGALGVWGLKAQQIAEFGEIVKVMAWRSNNQAKTWRRKGSEVLNSFPERSRRADMTRLDTSWGCCIERARSRRAGWEVLSVKQGERLVDLERAVAAETENCSE